MTIPTEKIRKACQELADHFEVLTWQRKIGSLEEAVEGTQGTVEELKLVGHGVVLCMTGNSYAQASLNNLGGIIETIKKSLAEKQETVNVPVKEYVELLKAEDELVRLEGAGVDNWDWYGDALNPEGEQSHYDFCQELNKKWGLK